MHTVHVMMGITVTSFLNQGVLGNQQLSTISFQVQRFKPCDLAALVDNHQGLHWTNPTVLMLSCLEGLAWLQVSHTTPRPWLLVGTFLHCIRAHVSSAVEI